jgi:hypothetical protein
VLHRWRSVWKFRRVLKDRGVSRATPLAGDTGDQVGVNPRNSL